MCPTIPPARRRIEGPSDPLAASATVPVSERPTSDARVLPVVLAAERRRRGGDCDGPVTEKSACLPRTSSRGARRGSSSLRSAGAQKRARLPSGSADSGMHRIRRRESSTDQLRFASSESISRARARYASAPAEEGACCMMLRPYAGASAKRIDLRTGGSRTSNP